MKKAYLVLIAVLISSASFAQSAQQINDMGLMNGCRDAKATNAQARYDQIMNSSAQSNAYKQAYQLGWGSCRNSQLTYVWYKGKLVLKGPATKPSSKTRPCEKDFPGVFGKDCLDDMSTPKY